MRRFRLYPLHYDYELLHYYYRPAPDGFMVTMIVPDEEEAFEFVLNCKEAVIKEKIVERIEEERERWGTM